MTSIKHLHLSYRKIQTAQDMSISFESVKNRIVQDYKSRGFKSLVLEDYHSDKPVPLQFASIYRRNIHLLLIFFAFAIFFAWWQQNLSFGFEDFTFLKPYVVFLMTIVYVWYFYIVYKELILDNPPEKIFWQQLLYPSFLGAAYLFYFLYSLLKYPSLKIFYLSFFLLHYALLFFRDYYEKQMKLSRRLEKLAWCIIEFLVCIIFVLAIVLFIFDAPFHIENLPPIQSNLHIISHLIQSFGKDIAVFSSIIIYLTVTYVIVSGNKNSNYRTVYSDLLRSIRLTSSPALTHFVQLPPNIRILDFGCANGQRLFEFLGCAGLKSSNKSLEIIGYDNISEWRDDFMEIFPNASFKNDFLQIKNEKFDIILVSHILYTSKALKELSKYINRQNAGCFIVFRGNALNSIFMGLSYFKSTKFAGQYKSHIWYDYWLSRLVKKCNLERADAQIEADIKPRFDEIEKSNRDSFNPPDIIISQVYTLKRHTIKHLVDFIEYLYDENLDFTMYDYLDEYVKYNDLTDISIPCDDMAYVYVKN